MPRKFSDLAYSFSGMCEEYWEGKARVQCPYSKEEVKQIKEYIRDGHSFDEASIRFNIPDVGTLHNVLSQEG